jgi:hypothetical protein
MNRTNQLIATAGMAYTISSWPGTANAGFYDTSLVWDANVPIHVCFEDISHPHEMELIRENVEASWGADSAYHFIWDTDGPCSGQPIRNLRVNLNDDDNFGCKPNNCGEEKVFGFGTGLNDVPGGIHICACTAVGDDLQQDYLRTAAGAEFGHALSFLHEQERLDTPFDCPEPGFRDGTGPTLQPIGPWDRDSVESYCSRPASHDGFLSPTDVETVSVMGSSSAAFPYALVSQRPGDLDIIARRRTAGQGGASVRTLTNGAWTPWTDLGAINGPASAPAAVAWDSTRLDVFMTGENGSVNWIYRTGTSGGTWSTWSDLGGSDLKLGDLVAVSRGPNRITLIARTVASTVAVREWDGTQWQPWRQVGHGPTCTSPTNVFGRPTTIVAQDGSVNIIVHAADHSVRTIRSTAIGTWPSCWTSIGGTILGSPSATPIKNAHNSVSVDIAVFARGSDNALWVNVLDNTLTWSGWSTLGAPSGGLANTPTAVSRDIGYVDVIASDSNGGVWETSRTPTGWSGTWRQLPAAGYTPASPSAIATSPTDMHVFTESTLYGTAHEHYTCTLPLRTGCAAYGWTVSKLPFVWWSDDIVY